MDRPPEMRRRRVASGLASLGGGTGGHIRLNSSLPMALVIKDDGPKSSGKGRRTSLGLVVMGAAAR